MFRSNFLTGLLTSSTFFASGQAARACEGAPAPLPYGSPSPNPLDQCDDDPVLRYDQRIEFKLRALDAPEVDLKDYLGKIVILNFFATWCGPCRAEQATLQEVATKYYDAGLRVIGLNYGEADNTVRRYRKDFNISYPIVMGAETILFRVQTNNIRGGNVVFPVSLFLWDNGTLSCYRRGYMGKDEIEYKVEDMLKQLRSGT